MEIKIADVNDINKIMDLLSEGREFLKDSNVDQWQGDYPNKEVIKDDINEQQSYVMIVNDEVVATMVLSLCDEEAYKNMLEGSWISNKPYGAIHRIAVSTKSKGLGYGKKIFDYCNEIGREKGIGSLRVDTHKDNIPMEKLIKSSGFKYCGVVIQAGGKRNAYEKLL